MKILLLLPIVIYMLFLLVNLDLLEQTQVIDLFWYQDIEAPMLLLSSIFIVFYSILVFFVYDWLNSYLHYKLNKQEKEIIMLKAHLYDWQEDLIKSIIKSFETLIKDTKKEDTSLFLKYQEQSNKIYHDMVSKNQENLEKHKSETDKILSKLNLLDESFFDKIKSFRKK